MEPWLVYFLIFVLVFLAVQSLNLGLGGAAVTRRDTAKRFAALAPPSRSDLELDILKRRASFLGRWSVVAALAALVVQSGTRLKPATLALIAGGLWFVLAVALPVPSEFMLRALLSGIVASMLVVTYLRIKRARRIARFGEQLPEVIDVIVRSLRAGHPLPVSLALVAREMPEPAGPEFTVVVDELSVGRDVTSALEYMSDRVGYPELRFLVASISIAHQTGGNLSEILSRLSRMLRDRFRLLRKVRALSAEGRFSGYALSALPLILFGLINLVSASYYADFWTSAAFGPVVGVSFALLLLGNLTIYRLVNFKV